MNQATKAHRQARTAQPATAADDAADVRTAQAVIADLMPGPASAPAAAPVPVPPPNARHQLSERFADPDLVDRIFEYLCEQVPALQQDPSRVAELKLATRAEFRGEEVYIPARGRTQRQELVCEAMRLFNGRNASEVARRLDVSRASVYRWIKQHGTR